MLLAHGGGGRLMHQLLERVFMSAFRNPFARHRGTTRPCSTLAAGGWRSPPTPTWCGRCSFPGGDIGTLAVNGTVNDLAMAGARPRYLSAGVHHRGRAAHGDARARRRVDARRGRGAAGVQIVTGDTKVVDRGKGDGLFINTAGIGLVEHDADASRRRRVSAGDAVVLSGDIGRHGMAIMAVREGLEFESAIESDCAPLAEPVLALLAAGLDVHCLRDLTRGGLASALERDCAGGAAWRSRSTSARCRCARTCAAACEILGFDPLYVANEGRFVAFVPEAQAARAVGVLQRPRGVPPGVRRLGRRAERSRAWSRCAVCSAPSRIVDMLSGEQLPRIC